MIALKEFLILRRPRSGRLEGRTTPIRPVGGFRNGPAVRERGLSEPFLPQAVAITRGFRRVVGRTITLDAEDETVRPFRVPNSDIDKITRYTDLRYGFAAHCPYLVDDKDFEV